MRKNNIWLAIVLALFMAGGAAADEVRYLYDENFPAGVISRADFQNNLRGLAQMDIGPLQPMAKRVLDGMEYSADSAAAAAYSGTGVTVTSDSSNEQEGSYSLKAVIDATDNRSMSRSLTINLSAFLSIKLWERSSQTSDTFRFYVEDSSGNQSYWDITSDASAGTWQQDTLTLASPDGNNGTAADLTDITSYGYQNLTASTTYYFDTVKAIVGMTVAVKGTNLGEYYRHVTFGGQPIQVDVQATPTLTAPIGNPRIDILTIDSSGTLAWVAGTEASTPAAPWSSVSQNVIPICEVYLKTSMSQVLDYEDKDTDTNQGYILSDDRPFIQAPFTWKKGADVASASSMTLGNDGNVFDITGTTTITSITAKPAGSIVILQFDGAVTVTDGSNLKLNGNFVSAAESVLSLYSDGTNWHEFARQPTASNFVQLTDTPSSYSGQALKVLRVNSGETSVELHTPSVLDASDTPASFTASKYWKTNAAGNAVEQVTGPGIFNSCQAFTTSGTWTKPADISKIYGRVWGNGGSGASGGTTTSGGGGGGGGYAEGLISVSSNVTVTINSSLSSFAGVTTLQATVGSNAAGTVGGAGGVGSGGTLNLTGGTGGSGSPSGATSNGYPGATGGGSPMGGAGGPGGGGSNTPTPASSGAAGTFPGGGGGGGGEGSNPGTGGTGGGGYVVICY